MLFVSVIRSRQQIDDRQFRHDAAVTEKARSLPVIQQNAVLHLRGSEESLTFCQLRKTFDKNVSTTEPFLDLSVLNDPLLIRIIR